MNTFTKDAVKKFNEWSRYINMVNNFNLAKVDRETIFGRIIIDGFQADPETAIRMIQDQAKDNFEMVKSIIGDFNIKLICG